MQVYRKGFIIGLAISALSMQVFAQAMTSWRSSNRDGIYQEKNLLSSWPEKGPELVMTLEDIGGGYSSPAVTGDRIYISGMIDQKGYLFSFDRKGKLLWKTEYGPEWYTAHSGVRGSPTATGNHVYIQSGVGHVICMNASDGKKVWTVDMEKRFGAITPKWGHAETMLLIDNQLICTPGGTKASVAALDPKTGTTRWTTKAGEEQSGYCSPTIVKHGSKPILITMLSASIIGIDPASHKLLWKHPHKTSYGVNPNTPIYSDGNVVYASGYGQGTGMLKLSGDGGKASQVWREPSLDPQMGGTVLLGTDLYGFGHKNKGLHCLDITTGKIKHSLAQKRGGVVISAGGKLYCYNEQGSVFLAQPERKAIRVISSFDIEQGRGPHWAHPVIDNGHLFVRHGAYLMVYDIGG